MRGILDPHLRGLRRPALFHEGFRLAAVRYGLAGMDALHFAAALAAGADEIVTSEKPGRPIHRVSAVPITTIHL